MVLGGLLGTFVTRQITRAVARIAQGLEHDLRLGNLGSLRDWGHARDYGRAMWPLRQASPAHATRVPLRARFRAARAGPCPRP